MESKFIKVSIIIPVLNEEINIPDVLNNLQSFRSKGQDVVIVDGGSRDNSLMLAQQGADLVIESKAGRARQMNSGAAVAIGDIFLFLHCATLLPDNDIEVVVGNFQR
mgnify:CR=1 FL=1